MSEPTTPEADLPKSTNRAAEVCQLLPRASDSFRMQVLVSEWTNEQAQSKYIELLESKRTTRLGLFGSEMVAKSGKWLLWAGLVFLGLVIGVIVLRGVSSAIDQVDNWNPLNDKTQEVSLPDFAQSVHARLSQSDEHAREWAHLFASFAEVQRQSGVMKNAEDLQQWMIAVGPGFVRQSGLRGIGLEPPMIDALLAYADWPELYADRPVESPELFFEGLSAAAVAVVNGSEVQWQESSLST